MRSPKYFSAAILLIAAFALCPAQTAKPLQYKKLHYPPLRSVQIPEPSRFELANGMVVYLLEDHDFPVINASVMVKTGSRFEPADKVGLASLTGQVMRTGGTTSRTGDEIDEMLERVGASVETFIGTSSGGARLSVLKEDIDLGLGVLSDVLRNPAFGDGKIELAKIAARTSIARRNDQVGAIASREFNRLVYGADNPYARLTEYETIENITKQDMVDFHRKYFVPNNTIIALWGDFNTKEMRAKVDSVFSSWPRQAVELPPLPAVRKATPRSVNFIKKDDVNQSQIYIGQIGGRLDDSDSAPLNLADDAFGGGFASRLFKHVRSEQGLAYSVFSSWGEDYDHAGLFRLGGSTKSATTVKMVQSILKELHEVVKDGITDDELKFAKDSYLNSFVFEYDTKGKVINEIMTLDYYGYPKDFVQKQQHDVVQTTREMVNDAIKKRWNPDAMAILVVGKEADFDEALSTLGTVRTIDIAIPAAPEKIPDPTPATTGKGMDLVKHLFDTMGGPKILTVKDVMESGKVTVLGTPMGDIEMQSEVTSVLPDKIINKSSMMMGEMTMVYDGKNGWVNTPMGMQDLPASQAEEMMKQAALNPMNVLQSLDKPAYAIYYFKDDKVDDKPVSVVIVKHVATGAVARWYIDNQTGLLAKTISRGRTQAGPGDIEEFFSDYRDEGGIKLAHKMETFSNGKKAIEMLVSTVKINAGVAAEAFQRPKE